MDAVTGWQPIETAPKGEDHHVLLYYPCNGGSFDGTIEGWWFQSFEEYDEMNDGWETRFGFIGKPTRWMPLPEPPK